nr:ABC transporter substrate-binding protein [Marinicella sp. W31]MDC2878980.1 ABC transporter substrate-binding protein [Marinicella sp. W31]
MNGFRKLLASGALSALGVVAGTLPATAADPVKVGYIIPLSGGAAASIGQEMSRATHMAVEQINAAGGIASLDGAPIELLEVDSRGDPKVALTEAERLITVEDVSVMIGAFQSSVTFLPQQLPKNTAFRGSSIWQPRPTSPSAATNMCSAPRRFPLQAMPTASSIS